MFLQLNISVLQKELIVSRYQKSGEKTRARDISSRICFPATDTSTHPPVGRINFVIILYKKKTNKFSNTDDYAVIVQSNQIH